MGKQANGRSAVREREKSTETREKLLDTAEALFIEQGYSGTSINDVATAAGVNKALIYYYFKNKQDLFDAVIERTFAIHNKTVLAAINTGTTVREQMHALLDGYLDYAEANPGHLRLTQREICSRNRNTDTITRKFEPVYQLATVVFGSLLPEDGPFSGRQFIASFFGMVVNYFTYSTALQGLWNKDLMDPSMLEDRRRHLHSLMDLMLDNYVDPSKV